MLWLYDYPALICVRMYRGEQDQVSAGRLHIEQNESNEGADGSLTFRTRSSMPALSDRVTRILYRVDSGKTYLINSFYIFAKSRHVENPLKSIRRIEDGRLVQSIC